MRNRGLAQKRCQNLQNSAWEERIYLCEKSACLRGKYEEKWNLFFSKGRKERRTIFQGSLFPYFFFLFILLILIFLLFFYWIGINFVK